MKKVYAITSEEMYIALRVLVAAVLGIILALAVWNLGFNAITTSGSTFVTGSMALIALTGGSVALGGGGGYFVFNALERITWRTVKLLRSLTRTKRIEDIWD